MHNVEIYNCSQVDTQNAAIRFDGASLRDVPSEIVGCSIHSGLGWGIFVHESKEIHFEDNLIYNFRPVGVVFESSRNITFKHNVVAHILEKKQTTNPFLSVLNTAFNVAIPS